MRFIEKLVVLSVLGAGSVLGQQVTREKAPEKATMRDPFAVSHQLQARSGSGGSNGATSYVAEGHPKLPKMYMRGYLKVQGRNPVAILAVSGGSTRVVRAGDTVSLYEVGNRMVVQIKSISRQHIVVEAGTLGEMIIVR